MRNLKRLTLAAVTVVSAAVLCVPAAFSQDLPPAGPKAKSQKEVEAIRAVQTATDADTRLQKIDEVLTNFADTEYKNLLLDMAVQTAQQKGDDTLLAAWAQRDLDANPHSALALITLANVTAGSVKEFDLDKQEKLSKAEKYAKDAVEAFKTDPKPMPSIPDAQWETTRKQGQAQAWQVLGIIETKRKNYDAAITDYKQAMEAAPSPNIQVRLGDAYEKEGKYDEAIAELDKAMADPAIDPRAKQIATSLKNAATKMKAAGIKPAVTAPNSGGTTPQQVEVKH